MVSSDALNQAEKHVKAGQLMEARAILEPLLVEAPENVRLHRLLADLYIRQTDWQGLRKEMERQLGQHPPDVAEYERSYLSLLFGEMPKGWDQWESRLRIPGKVSPSRSFPQPRWQGETFEGKTLLLYFEQGFGDTFMFLRYAPLVKARGGRVVLLAQKQLAAVAATCRGIDEVIVDGQPLPSFDLHLPLPSLPHVFRTELTTIPAEIPYLDVPAAVPQRERIAQRLAATEGKIRVACAWAGSPNHARDKERSIPRKLFKLLETVPGVAWYSFQFGVMNEPPLPGLISMAPVLTTFADTAYALSGMDLVITVDTALAHLAGAMGIPVLLMVHFQPDFRWMLHREDSPWYPSLRIYRQPSPGDWESVLMRIRQDLSEG